MAIFSFSFANIVCVCARCLVNCFFVNLLTSKNRTSAPFA